MPDSRVGGWRWPGQRNTGVSRWMGTCRVLSRTGWSRGVWWRFWPLSVWTDPPSSQTDPSSAGTDPPSSDTDPSSPGTDPSSLRQTFHSLTIPQDSPPATLCSPSPAQVPSFMHGVEVVLFPLSVCLYPLLKMSAGRATPRQMPEPRGFTPQAWGYL